MDGPNEKNYAFGEGDSFKPEGNYDPEGQRRGSTIVAGRKMSRIGPPPKGSISASAPVGDELDSQAQLVAMEANNAIKYRTCSWPMVSHLLPIHTATTVPPPKQKANVTCTDGSFTLLGIHLSRHHVLPILLLGSRTSSWHYPDCCPSRIRTVHLAHYLVSLVFTRSACGSDNAKGILSPSSRSLGCLRHWTNAVLEFLFGLVGHSRHVHLEQHLHSGPPCVDHRSLSQHHEQPQPLHRWIRSDWCGRLLAGVDATYLQRSCKDGHCISILHIRLRHSRSCIRWRRGEARYRRIHTSSKPL